MIPRCLVLNVLDVAEKMFLQISFKYLENKWNKIEMKDQCSAVSSQKQYDPL